MEILTGSSKDAYQLAGRAAIVGDWNDIAESALLRLSNGIEDVDEIVRSAAAGEDDNAVACGGCKRGRSRRCRLGRGQAERTLPAIGKVMSGHSFRDL